MNIVVLFFAAKNALLRLRLAVQLSIAWFVAVNVVGAIYFMPRTLAWLVLISFMLNALVMASVLIDMKAFTRILARSHLPLLSGMASVVSRLDRIDFESAFGLWIVALMLTNSIALLFGAYNVWRYWQGNRALGINADMAGNEKQVIISNVSKSGTGARLPASRSKGFLTLLFVIPSVARNLVFASLRFRAMLGMTEK